MTKPGYMGTTGITDPGDPPEIGEPDISDPEVYWPMAIYSLKVSNILMSLRHLYTPADAMRWFLEPQKLLGDRVPAEMLETEEGAKKVQAIIQAILDGAYI